MLPTPARAAPRAAWKSKKSLGIHEPLLRMAVRELGDASSSPGQRAAFRCQKRAFGPADFYCHIGAADERPQSDRWKYSRERILATNGPAPTHGFSRSGVQGRRASDEAALPAIAGSGGENRHHAPKNLVKNLERWRRWPATAKGARISCPQPSPLDFSWLCVLAH